MVILAASLPTLCYPVADWDPFSMGMRSSTNCWPSCMTFLSVQIPLVRFPSTCPHGRYKVSPPLSDKSTGKANFTCNIRVTSEVSSGFPPNTSHPSGKLRASRWSTCLVSPAWKCAWSIPIRRSTCLLSRRNFVFCGPTRSDMCEVLTAVISSWW